ncbi:hypothetical protein EW145_g8089 [Phellinidium pouzarii]|uniref:Uncharacterized protein n=1 Tax=Phellinidium pouzarii TaxID=167371 RepID=A0A4S4K9W0_9AGAM|nr:hypothetical protein EW145_g8089 [Phellinidium pouzarii]
MYGGSHSAHPGLHPLSPADEHSQSGFSPASYGSTGMQYGYADSNSWALSPSSAGSSSQQGTGSLSSLLNPSGNHQYSRGSLQQQSYPPPFSSVPLQNNHSTVSLSPDSRPTTGYSVSSMSSLPYDTESTSTSISHDYSRPGSSHHRPMSPSRPHSSHKFSLGGSLGGMSSGYSSSSTGYGVGVGGSAVRRQRRHSQAMSPYPSPYDNGSGHGHHLDSPVHGMHHSAHAQRPSSSPQPAPLTPGAAEHQTHQSQVHSSIPRVRSLVQLPAVDTTPQTSAYTFSPGGDFAYSAGGASNGQGSPPLHSSQGTGHLSSVDAMDWGRSVRPSTSASSLSAASHTSSSQANTPPVDSTYGAGEDINRCE